MDTPVISSDARLRPAALPPECERCTLARLCHPTGDGSTPRATQTMRCQRRIYRGEAVYRTGDALQNLYELRSGSMKMRVTSRAGTEQIMAFPAAGALLGLDAIGTGAHRCDAIALEDSTVCILPFSDVTGRCRDDFAWAQQLNRLIARDIDQYRRLMLTLGSMKSDERIADFLLGLSEQMAANGYSPRVFTLKMTRGDIANHLGMKIETVCRVLARLQKASLVKVSRRQLEIRSVEALRQMSCG